MERYNVDESICKIISSGSHGNCVVYHNSIMVDLGVPYKWIKEIKNDIQLLLLTHEHSDHINIPAIRNLCFERPSMRIGCGEFMLKHLDGIKNVDVYESGNVYDYGSFKIFPVTLYHDVKTFGYRIFKGEHKAIHITDTAHLEGITAKDYDLYAIESNYDCENIEEKIKQAEISGKFAYQRNSINSHLSFKQANDFIFNTKKKRRKSFDFMNQKTNKMQEELNEIEILTFIYKTLKEKAEPRVTKYGTTIYRCDDSNLFEIYECDGEEEFWIGDKRIDHKTLKLIKEKLKEPEPFYCQEGGVCDKQCSTCFSKEL